MRLMFLGDIVGCSGRTAVIDGVPMLRRRLGLDFVVVNGENAAGGFGITAKLAEELYAAGVDCLTLGNHAWDQRELMTTIDDDPRMVRPANYPPGTPGRGSAILDAPGGRRVLVINLMARLFMDPLDDPFGHADRLLADLAMPRDVDAILVDFHGEATSEKMAMGHHLDGRVSLVVGTHSHVPTADVHILTHGTAYQTDAGMCGDYDSVIGMKKEPAVLRFVRKLPTERLTAAEKPATLCGLVVETDDATGLVVRAEPIRLGGRLPGAWPDFQLARAPVDAAD